MRTSCRVRARPRARPGCRGKETDMSNGITFTLDGTEVEARQGETIWQVATRLGSEIPHLCHRPEPGYRPDGNCRACMVEIEGERVLAPSCMRQPTPGMKVRSASDRAAGKLWLTRTPLGARSATGSA